MQKKTTALLVSTGIAGIVAGVVLTSGLSATAADDSGSSTGTSSYAAPYGAPSGTAPQGRPGTGDPTKPMRSDEKLLTGDTLAKVTAAVKAEYPGATFQRVETDSDGVYEAHLLVDGRPVTVEVDKTFAVTGTESAPAAAPGSDHAGPAAPAPAA